MLGAMVVNILGGVVLACAAVLWLSTLTLNRSLARRREIVNMGIQLKTPDQVMAVYRHDRSCIRLLERIVQQDRTIPILPKEDRTEADRLIQAFYDDKGD